MYELAYSSTACPSIAQQDIHTILEVARNFNAQHKITGCLVYHNHQFVQIIEGRKQTIQTLYTKIKSDNRHSNIQLLYEGTKAHRTFENWSMAFQKLNPNQLQTIDEQLFAKNIILLSELADKPTFTVKLFWNKVRQIIKTWEIEKKLSNY